MSVQALTVLLLLICADILPACLLWDKPSVLPRVKTMTSGTPGLPPGMAVASWREYPLDDVLSAACRFGV